MKPQANPIGKFVALQLPAWAVFTLALAASGSAAQAQSDSAPAAATPVPARKPAENAPAPIPPMNRNVVVLDAAHGGPDAGAKLADQLLEKDVTLAVAGRLGALLTAAGFTVISTREGDVLTALTVDQRAETANRAHASACLVLHASRSGAGVHLYVSDLPAKEPPVVAEGERPPFDPTPWETAQAESVRQSLHLAGDLHEALVTAKLPVVAGRAGLRPLDSLMCPAVAVELAPLTLGDTSSLTDADYQRRVAEAVAAALKTWRGRVEAAPAKAAEASPATPQARAAVKATAAADAAGRKAAAAPAKAAPSGGTP